MEIPRMRTHLVGKCAGSVCRDAACAEVAKHCEYDGRWYITMGHAGFNSPANNRNGYASQAKALAAWRRYSAKGAEAAEKAALDDAMQNACYGRQIPVLELSALFKAARAKVAAGESPEAAAAAVFQPYPQRS